MSSLINKAALALYGGATLMGVLTLWGLCDLVLAESVSKGKGNLFSRIKGSTADSAPKKVMDDYITVLPDRFCGRVTPGRSTKTRRPRGLQAVYVLRGTLLHSDPSLSRAFIEVPGVSGQQAFSPGDTVHGAKLLNIGKDSVLLKKSGQQINLKVSFKETQPKGFKPTTPGVASSGKEESVQAYLNKLPPSMRRLVERATPKQQAALMALPPKERRAALMKFIKRARQAQRRNKSKKTKSL